MFPFTDGPETDPETGRTDSLLGLAEARHVAPKIMHILSNSEYFNRAGSLIHADPQGRSDIEPPANSRIYVVSSGPHGAGPMPPSRPEGAAALNNPLDRRLIVVALLKALDAWVVDGTPPPSSRIPQISHGTLVPTEKAGWPAIPGVHFPVPFLKTYRLNFGPGWSRGIVTDEPPKIGKPFTGLVPAVDENGNSLAGIRLPAVELPLGTYGGWNFRSSSIGSPDQLFGEVGSFHPLPCTKDRRIATGDSRLSLEERYGSRDKYQAEVTKSAQKLVEERLLLVDDIQGFVEWTMNLYDWATRTNCH
jgi:hypothetical protein